MDQIDDSAKGKTFFSLLLQTDGYREIRMEIRSSILTPYYVRNGLKVGKIGDKYIPAESCIIKFNRIGIIFRDTREPIIIYADNEILTIKHLEQFGEWLLQRDIKKPKPKKRLTK
jgi:hypothetical protein